MLWSIENHADLDNVRHYAIIDSLNVEETIANCEQVDIEKQLAGDNKVVYQDLSIVGDNDYKQ